MDREHQLQSPGFFHRIYNFLKSLVTYALKIMTSTFLVHHGSAQAQHPIARGVPPNEAANFGAKFESEHAAGTCEQDKGVSDTLSAAPHVGEERRLEQETSFSADSSQARPPKKMVSINDDVETIILRKKKSSKEEVEVEHEPRPLKSILKVGSDLNNGSGMPVYPVHTSGA